MKYIAPIRYLCITHAPFSRRFHTFRTPISSYSQNYNYYNHKDSISSFNTEHSIRSISTFGYGLSEFPYMEYIPLSRNERRNKEWTKDWK